MLKGVNGLIKWHYHTAAVINGYTVACSKPDRQWSMRATVTTVDDFKLAQTPLIFVATHQGGEWRWVIQTLAREGNTVSASLSAPLNEGGRLG